MTTETPSNARLLQAFAYSMDDIVANRRGSLTTRQQEIIARHIAIGSWSSRLAILMFLGSAAFFLIGAPFLINEESVPQQVLPYLVGTALVLLVIVGVFVGIGLRRVRTLRQAHISVIEGTIRCTMKHFKHGRWTAYYGWIEGIRFQLTTEQQYKVLVEGKTYRIYYIHYPPTHLILSIEELPGI